MNLDFPRLRQPVDTVLHLLDRDQLADRGARGADQNVDTVQGENGVRPSCRGQDLPSDEGFEESAGIQLSGHVRHYRPRG